MWNSILEQGGTVQHLDFLTREEKDTYKTSFEIDQRWLIELAADRTPYIDQAQSLNLFIPADVDKWDLLMLHFRAWELGIKSLYYLRSKSIQRAGFAGGVEADNTAGAPSMSSRRPTMTSAWRVSESHRSPCGRIRWGCRRLRPKSSAGASQATAALIAGGIRLRAVRLPIPPSLGSRGRCLKAQPAPRRHRPRAPSPPRHDRRGRARCWHALREALPG